MSLSPFKLPTVEVVRPLIYPTASTYHATGHINNERHPWNITNQCQFECCKLLDKVLGSLRRARSVWLKTTVTYELSWGNVMTTTTSGSITACYISHIYKNSSLLHKNKNQQPSCFKSPYTKSVSLCVWFSITLCLPVTSWYIRHLPVVLFVCQSLTPSFSLTSHFSFFPSGKCNVGLLLCYWDSSLRTVP